MTPGRRIFLDRTDRLQRLTVPSMELARTAERLRRRGLEILDLARVVPSENPFVQLPESVDGWKPATSEHVAGLREAAAQWYEHRFGVSLDPDTEITVAPNAVIGLSQLSMAFIEAGDMALLPDPGVPFYRGAVVMAGGGVVSYHLTEANRYRPRIAALEERLVGRTRLMLLSYPHNPSTAAGDLEFFTEVARFARKHQILIVSDAAFAFVRDEKLSHPSFLSAPYATGVGVEIASLESNFGIDGLNLALICGNREAIAALDFLTQSSRWTPTRGQVEVAIHLLVNADQILAARSARLKAAHHIIAETVSEIGWTLAAPDSTLPFVWASVPAHIGSEAFCRRILRRTGILLAPGSNFGPGGEGFIRVAIPEDEHIARTVQERLLRHASAYQRRLPRPRRRLRDRLASDTSVE